MNPGSTKSKILSIVKAVRLVMMCKSTSCGATSFNLKRFCFLRVACSSPTQIACSLPSKSVREAVHAMADFTVASTATASHLADASHLCCLQGH